jgi:hypothetical protein
MLPRLSAAQLLRFRDSDALVVVAIERCTCNNHHPISTITLVAITLDPQWFSRIMRSSSCRVCNSYSYNDPFPQNITWTSSICLYTRLVNVVGSMMVFAVTMIGTPRMMGQILM